MIKLRVTTIGLLSLLLLVSAAPAPAPVAPQPVSDWAFAGCFSPTRSLPCYDVYTHNGAYWICNQCGNTKNPSETKCRPLSSYQLAHGAWCS